jgi:acetate kinase
LRDGWFVNSTPPMKILVLNAGSSSDKSCLYDINGLPDSPPTPIWEAARDGARLKVETAAGAVFEATVDENCPAEHIPQMLATMWSGLTQVLGAPHEIDIVGHRVVHGGRKYFHATRLGPQVLAEIESLSALAPSHNPAALRGIRAVEQVLSDVPQVAVFDTAFHHGIPDAAAFYPGPYEWAEQGIRRYGFHGINHEHCARRAAQVLGRGVESLRLISCHLGSGCSLAAVKNGRSVDTTMGFTPLEGLMMGTRSGSVDPGILLHLLRGGKSGAELDRILNKESGLKGISGATGDMRDIEAAAARGDERARLAFEMFVHRVRSHIGSMLASLGGLDALIFTAGIGENSARVRAEACAAFEFLGLELDADKNARHPVDEDIATSESRVRVLVLRAQENWAIAQKCWKLARAST